ncbi:helix-turn-helix transcriptional regulator [Polymorphospora rubra]
MERQTELARLDDHLRDCLAGRSAVVVVTGAVASGKTELVHHFAARASRTGTRVLSAAASRAEREMPLGVMRQLFRHSRLAGARQRQVDELLDDSLRGSPLSAADIGDQLDARLPHQLGNVLLDLAAEEPLVIAVDDVHHADTASLRCLAYLVRRLRSARIMLLLTESPRIQVRHPEAYAELLHPSGIRRIRLAPLSRGGVRAVLEARLGEATAEQLATDCHRATGGVPLLVDALLDDNHGTDRPAGELVTGDAFDEAVLACLYRCEHRVLEIARAVAVAGGDIDPELVHQLLGIPPATATALSAATTAGLLDEHGLCSPEVTRAVLAGMVPEERAALHGRVAELLHHKGAPATTVAPHLVETTTVSQPWTVTVLLEAADQVLLDGDVERARRYLRTAERYCTNRPQRARVRAALARVEWRIDPATTIRHLPDLTEAAREGHLTGRQGLRLIHHLTWHGRVSEALDIIRHLKSTQARDDADLAAELFVARVWLSSFYPSLLPDLRRELGTTRRDRFTVARIRARLQGRATLSAVLTGDFEQDTVRAAEQVLLGAGLDEHRLWPTVTALFTLVQAERLDTVDEWCRRLGGDPTPHRHPTALALLAAVRAEVAIRRGDLAQALELTRDAFAAMSPESWGVLVGIPLATRLRAATLMGRFEEAAECLRVPVPQAMFDTPFGLCYLRARGQYHLATGNAESALVAFQLCGELLARWQIDLPTLVPWRTDAARTCLRLGRQKLASRLIGEQLDRIGPRHKRLRGAALRTLAATTDTTRRPPVLWEAAQLLQECGDQVELAHALTDLGVAHRVLGNHRHAELAVRSARTVAEQCRVELLRRSLNGTAESVLADPATMAAPLPGIATTRVLTGPPAAGTLAAPVGAEVAAPMSELSAAEQRVATLAAQGHTNREIASKLFLTVSTVEQHLTRIYRKLKVTRRRELSGRLRWGPAVSRAESTVPARAQ